MDLFYYLKLCIGLIEIWQKVLNIQGADDFLLVMNALRFVSSVFGLFDWWILLLSLSPFHHVPHFFHLLFSTWK